MWVSELHSGNGEDRNCIDIIAKEQKEAMMQELPSDNLYLKKLVVELLCCNVIISTRCKHTIKKLTSANVILAAKLGNTKDVIHIIQERNIKKKVEVQENKNSITQTNADAHMKDVAQKKEQTKNEHIIKELSNEPVNDENGMNGKDENEKDDSGSNLCKIKAEQEKIHSNSFFRKKSIPKTEAIQKPTAENKASLKETKVSNNNPNTMANGTGKKSNTFDSLKGNESIRVPDMDVNGNIIKKGNATDVNGARPNIEMQSPVISIHKDGESKFGLDDPKTFEYKEHLGEKLVLVSYVFKIPHANPVPPEVFRFYYNSNRTYLRRHQLPEMRDGSLFLKRSIYKEEEDDDDANEKNNLVVFEKDNTSSTFYIKAITKGKLIQRLLRPMMDSYYDYVVILMHSTFMDSISLLKMFSKRVRIVSDYGPLSEERMAFNKLCRMRVVRLLAKWIEHFWTDFSSDEVLLRELKDLITNLFRQYDESMKHALIDLVKNKEEEMYKLEKEINYILDDNEYNEDTNKIEGFPLSLLKQETSKLSVTKGASVLNFPFSFTKKLKDQSMSVKAHNNIPENPEEALEFFMNKFSALTPDSIARQMTLIELMLIKKIRPKELLDLAWTKDNKENTSGNVIELTKWSNHIIHLFTTDIVASKDNIRARVSSFEKTVLIAECLEKLNNYNGLVEVMAALMSASVYRLKKTREMMEPRISLKFEELKNLISGKLNYKKLREIISNCKLPFLPFPGLIQSDLVMYHV